MDARKVVIVAGFQALAEAQPQITVRAGDTVLGGELVLIGNGSLYGGSFEILPEARLQDGILDVCVFPKVNLPALLRCAPSFLLRRRLPEKMVRRLRADKFELSSQTPAAFELDGEWVGHLPVTFSVEREKLRVAVP